MLSLLCSWARHFKTRTQKGQANLYILAQITRITLKWRYTEYTVLNIFHRSGFSSNLHLPWKTEFALKIFAVLNIFLSFRSFEQLALSLRNRVYFKFTVLNIGYIFFHSAFLNNLLLSWKQSLPWNFSKRGGCCPPASYACDHRVCELPMAFLFQNIRKRFYCTSFSAHNL